MTDNLKCSTPEAEATKAYLLSLPVEQRMPEFIRIARQRFAERKAALYAKAQG